MKNYKKIDEFTAIAMKCNKEQFAEVNNGVVKNEIKIGDWTTSVNSKKTAIKVTDLKDDFIIGYGINYKGDWIDEKEVWKITNDLRVLTPQEVQTALEKEAVKRGFVDGVSFKDWEIWTKYGNITFEFKEKYNRLYMWSDFSETKHDGYKSNNRSKSLIFKNGIWAEIVKPETNDIEVTEPTIVTEKCVSIPFSTVDSLSNNFNLGEYVRKIRNE